MSEDDAAPSAVERLAQAVLNGRLRISGEDWLNRDGEHKWWFEVTISDD